jgi:phosphonate transport system permease protein
MGFLAKFYAEEMERVNTDPIDALKSTGASQLQIFMFAVVPQVLNAFIAYNLYILDRNVRMATMLGIVGAGGIGYELISAFRMFRYPQVTTIIIIIFLTILIIDFISGWIRNKLD